MSKDNIIEFAKVEYCPQGLGTKDKAEIQQARYLYKRQNPQIVRLPKDSKEVKLEQLPTRQTKNILSKACGIQVIGRVYKKSNNVRDSIRVYTTTFIQLQ